MLVARKYVWLYGIMAILVGFVLLAGCGGGGGGQQEGGEEQQTVSLRYAHPNAADDIPGRFANEFALEVDERTDGRVQINVFPASQLGGVQEMLEGTQAGSIDMGHNNYSAVAQLDFPDIQVFDVPYLYRDPQHMLAATDPETSPVVEELNQELVSQTNVRTIGAFFHGTRQLTCSCEVNAPEDLRGKKIRAIPLPVWISTVEGMKAIATPVDFSELPTALQTGVVDGQENPISTIYASGLYDTQSHLMMTSHMISPLTVFINEDSWNKLSDEDQQVMQEVQQEISQKTVEWNEEEVKRIVPLLEEEGMTVIDEGSGLDLEAFRTAVTERFEQEFSQWYGQEKNYIERLKAVEAGSEQ